jgi:uncharacterized protein YukE
MGIYRQSDRIRNLHRKIASQTAALSKTWSGEGARLFRQEIEDLVLPSVKRLSNSLELSGIALRRIIITFREAEEDAVRMLDVESQKHIRLSPDAKDTFRWGEYDAKEGWKKKQSIGIKTKIVEGEYYDFEDIKGDIRWGKTDIGDYESDSKLVQGEAGFGIETDSDGDLAAGVFAEGRVWQTTGEAVLGGRHFGGTASGKVEGLSAEGFLGLKDGSVGAEVGVALASAEASLGANVAGYNVGVHGGLIAGWKMGIRIGKRTRAKLGVFQFGLDFGKAKTY